MKVLFCNIDLVPNEVCHAFARMMPEFMQQEIFRYRNIVDQNARILARAIIARYFNSDFRLLRKWQTDTNKKPFIPGVQQFNISHSGNIAAVVFSEHTVGIDVEEMRMIELKRIAALFSQEEQLHLKLFNYHPDVFYSLWTKKEAYLKATGVGIVDGLDRVTVIDNELEHGNKCWNFQECDVGEGYKCFVCVPRDSVAVEIENVKLF